MAWGENMLLETTDKKQRLLFTLSNVDMINTFVKCLKGQNLGNILN